MLQKFVSMFAKAMLDQAVSWVKDPENADDVKAVGKFIADRIAGTVAEGLPTLVDSATDVTPWEWDDELIDGFVAKLAPTLAKLIAGNINLGNIIGGFLK